MEQQKELFQREEQKGCYRKLMQFPDEEYVHRTVYSPRGDLFTCSTSCPPEAVEMVILGQDPCHQPNQAYRLYSSVRKSVQISCSLKNIYRELKNDMNTDAPSHGCLTDWTEQGVFLTNMIMSVQEGQAASYKKRGWETFTDTVISVLDEQEKGIVFVLWGSHAQKEAELIIDRQHHILISAYPPPLSASGGFFGSRSFSTADRYLEEVGETSVDWRLSE